MENNRVKLMLCLFKIHSFELPTNSLKTLFFFFFYKTLRWHRTHAHPRTSQFYYQLGYPTPYHYRKFYSI